MEYLVRMIEIGNWSDTDGNVLAPNKYKNVHADGITKDLKSDGDTISLWEIDDLNELNDVAISLLTSRNSPQNLYVVAIPKKVISEKLELENNNNAETAYKKFESKHYDLLEMNLEKLEALSELILSQLQDVNNTYDLVFSQEKERIKQLITSGEIDLDKLKGRLRKEFDA